MYDKCSVETVILLLFFIQTTNSVAKNRNAGKKEFHGTDLLTNNHRISGFLKRAKPQEAQTKIQWY